MIWTAKHICAFLLFCVVVSPAMAGRQGLIEDPAGANADWCENRKLGTWFYCAKPRPAEKAEPAAVVPTVPATERLNAITKQLNELRAEAILTPSPENISAYVRFQREQLDRSSLFADVWQRALWQNPELDYTLERPVSNLGKQAFMDDRKADREQTLVRLGDRYGVFYFFASTCSPCKLFSPILKSVADSHRLNVMAISTDGGPNDVFTRYVVDTGQRQRMGISSATVPAVVLFDSRTKTTIPIGYGLMSADELMERIYVLTKKEVGRDF